MKLKDLIPEDKGPCWKGYEMIGMKDKGGKQVPNCVPISEEYDVVNEEDLNDFIPYLREYQTSFLFYELDVSYILFDTFLILSLLILPCSTRPISSFMSWSWVITIMSCSK